MRGGSQSGAACSAASRFLAAASPGRFQRAQAGTGQGMNQLKRNRAIRMLPRCVDLPLDVENRTQVLCLKIIRIRYDGLWEWGTPLEIPDSVH